MQKAVANLLMLVTRRGVEQTSNQTLAKDTFMYSLSAGLFPCQGQRYLPASSGVARDIRQLTLLINPLQIFSQYIIFLRCKL